MNKQAGADPTRERRRLYVHMLWPDSVKQRMKQAAADTGLSLTEIVLRLIDRAQEKGVLLDWVKAGPPARLPQNKEAATR